jgi:hypothetical protein
MAPWRNLKEYSMAHSQGEQGVRVEKSSRELDQRILELAGQALCELELGRPNSAEELRVRVRIIDELGAREGETGGKYYDLVTYDPQFALLVLGYAHEHARRQLPERTDPWNDPDPAQYDIYQLFELLSRSYWPLYHLSQNADQWRAELYTAAGRRSEAQHKEMIQRINARFPEGSLLR